MKKDNKADPLLMLLVLPFAAAFCFAFSLWEGYVLTCVWHWHVGPYGLPELSVNHAAGVCLMAVLLTHQQRLLSDEESCYVVFSGLYCSLMVLFVGWWLA